MRKSTIILLVVLAVLASIVGSVVYASRPSGSQKITQALIDKDTPSQDASVTAVDTPKAELVNLITVDDPFQRDGIPRTTYVTTDDGQFSSISSVTSYHIATSNYVLPADFSDIGTQYTTMTSSQPVSIIQQLVFDTDSVITWGTAEEPNALYQWESHPDQMFVHAGQTVVVTYASTDGGVHWTASVDVPAGSSG